MSSSEKWQASTTSSVRASASGIVAEQPRHFGRRLEVAFGIGLQGEAGGLDGAAQADAGHDVLQRPTLRGVVEHVVGGDQFQAALLRQPRQCAQPPFIVAVMAPAGGEPSAMAEQVAEAGQGGAEAAVQLGRRHHQHRLSGDMRRQVVKPERAVALYCP